MRRPPSRPRKSSGDPSRSTIPSGPDTCRHPAGASWGGVPAARTPSASAALSSTGPPRKKTWGGFTTSRHWWSTSSTGVSEGWLRITPRLPSALDSSTSSTQRAKLGSTNVAEEISREPAEGCMPPMVALSADSASRSAACLPGEQGRGDGGQPLAAPGEAEPVGGGGAEGDVDVVPLGDAPPGLLGAWADPGSVADELAGDVADSPAGGANPPQGLGEQVVARGAGPLWVRRT